MTVTTRHRIVGSALAGLVIAAVATRVGADLIDAAGLALLFAMSCAMISAPDAPSA